MAARVNPPQDGECATGDASAADAMEVGLAPSLASAETASTKPTPSLASPRATKAVLDRFGLRAKHGLGQHFLVDRGVLDRICELADVRADDRVLEVGPGIGTLTQALLSRGAQVTAIERDADLLPVLAETCAPWRERLQVIAGDALAVTPEGCASKLISNLPYNVAATLVLSFLDRWPGLESLTIMVQREVAERMVARPGGKDYGAYSVKLQLRSVFRGSFRVERSCFSPPPHVDSTVLRLDRRPEAYANAQPTGFGSCDESMPFDGEPSSATVRPTELVQRASLLADAAFAHRRKTLLNSMTAFFRGRGPEGQRMAANLRDLLTAAQIDSSRRGETLSPDDFLRLASHLSTRFMPLRASFF